LLCGCHAAPRSAPGGPLGEDQALRIASADGRNELVIEGLFQVMALATGDERQPRSDIALKRMRPELAGHVAGGLEFRLEPNFSSDDVELEEAWIGPALWGGDAHLMLGRMKAPFNLEEVRSRRHIDFPRFSLLNQFAPAEDHGAFLYGRSPSGYWEYGVAAYNGTGGADTNNGKDVAARIMVHPFASDTGSRWSNLQLGVAATTGRQDEDVSDAAVDNEAGLAVVRFAPDARLDGDRSRLGLELAWFDGPWFVQAEVLYLEQRMSSSGGAADATARGGYVTLSRALTGEDKSFRGVRPDAPYDFQSGAGRGAWVLALRYSALALDEDLESAALVVPGTYTDRISSLSLGLNWIPNEHAILRTAWVQSLYADEVALDRGATDREGALLIEVQLHF
jgi:phosphate-selective porin